MGVRDSLPEHYRPPVANAWLNTWGHFLAGHRRLRKLNTSFPQIELPKYPKV